MTTVLTSRVNKRYWLGGVLSFKSATVYLSHMLCVAKTELMLANRVINLKCIAMAPKGSQIGNAMMRRDVGSGAAEEPKYI